jgi:hypothetical protein
MRTVRPGGGGPPCRLLVRGWPRLPALPVESCLGVATTCPLSMNGTLEGGHALPMAVGHAAPSGRLARVVTGRCPSGWRSPGPIHAGGRPERSRSSPTPATRTSGWNVAPSMRHVRGSRTGTCRPRAVVDGQRLERPVTPWSEPTSRGLADLPARVCVGAERLGEHLAAPGVQSAAGGFCQEAMRGSGVDDEVRPAPCGLDAFGVPLVDLVDPLARVSGGLPELDVPGDEPLTPDVVR